MSDTCSLPTIPHLAADQASSSFIELVLRTKRDFATVARIIASDPSNRLSLHDVTEQACAERFAHILWCGLTGSPGWQGERNVNARLRSNADRRQPLVASRM